MRPEAPVPGTWVRSTLLSLAILRTSGEERRRSVSEALAATGCGTDAATGAGAAAGADGAAAGLPAAPPITATTVLMLTVEPSGTLISERTPAMGEGISASTLSVEISKMGSSRWTVSPTFLSHLVMVPSVMDSPIWGISTSVPAAAAAGWAGVWLVAGVSTAAGVAVLAWGPFVP